MPKKLLYVLAGCFLAVLSSAHNDTTIKTIVPHASPALRFTENLGQWQDNVLFRAQLDGGALFLEKNCLTYEFYDKVKFRALGHGHATRGKGVYKDDKIKHHAYRVSFEGSNPNPGVEKLQQGSDYENFYLGNDPAKWKSSVKNYHQLWLRNIYNNIDYEVFTTTQGIKYNFHVKPGALVQNIKLRYDGVERMKLKNGALVLELEASGVTEQRPYAYQMINGKTVRVACNYVLKNKILSFEFPNGYNRSHTLVIDPVLVFAAQSGSNVDNWGMTATFDAQGNLYAGGIAGGTGYPMTIGAYDITYNGGTWDVVITKYNATGNNLLYSTYLGGSQTEVVSSLIVDNAGNLCLYGTTGSANFPMTQGAYDNTFNGGPPVIFHLSGTSYPSGSDIYIAKFNSSGTSLLASTFLGGSDNDGLNHINHLTLVPNPFNPNQFQLQLLYDSLSFNYGDQNRGEIQVDVLNNIFITSSTRSSNFPTANAFDNTLGGKQDAIVCKLNPGLTQLLFSSYLGGSQNDCGNSLIVTDDFDVYVTGGTCSPNFPVTGASFDPTFNGGTADGFLVRINPQGNQILNGTFVGTNSYDQSYFVQSDRYKQIYIYGQSLGNMPVANTTGTSIPFSVSGTHQFIARYNTTLSTRNMSTKFGRYLNSTDISPCAFSVDKCHNIYISGWGGDILTGNNPMNNMPLFQPTQSNTTGFDFYFMALDSLFQLKYGSYFGGTTSQEHVDGGTSRFDPKGRIYQSMCAGCGGFDDFPVTNGAWPNTPGNPNHASNCNNGVVKLDFQLQLSIATINTATLAGCAPFTTTLINANPPSNPGATYLWDFGNGITTSTQINPVVTYTAPGTYTITLETNDNLTCNKKDFTKTYITIYPRPQANISANYSQCSNTVALSSSVSGSLAAQPYAWNFGDGTGISTLSNPTHTYTNNGTYNITFTVSNANGCQEVKSTTVSVFDFQPGATPKDTICFGKSTNIRASGGTSYLWQPTIGLANSSSANTTASPTLNTTYTVLISNNTPGYTCTKSLTTEIQVDPTPTVNFNYTVNPCGGGVYFNDLTVSNAIAWKWNLGTAKTSTLQNPYIFYTKGGTYTVNLESTNQFGCSEQLAKQVTVTDPEPVTATGNTIICKGDKAQLTAAGGIAYQWSPPATLDMPESANPVASPVTSTEYSVNIVTSRTVDIGPCNYMLLTQVDVGILSSVPVKAVADPVLIVTGSSSKLTYVGDEGATVLWYPLGSTNPPTGYSVNASPARPTTYTVIATRGPCTETVLVHVDAFSAGCLEADVFVPNTFTPNGDGNNDELFVRSAKISELYFAVYNRWGEMVFETKDKNKGWNGEYKGRPADVGVFGWYLKARCVNGEEAFLKGNVTLIR